MRRPRAWAVGAAIAAQLVACGPGRRSFEEPVMLGGVEVAPAVLNRGEMGYMRYCRGCHGPLGRGDGPYGASLSPRPANLTLGAYPRSGAEAGSLPSNEQLRRIVDRGIEGTGMGPQRMPPEDRDAIVEYLKTLSPVWRGGERAQRVQ